MQVASLADFAIWPVLPASDIERAKAWYDQKLGLSSSKEDPSGSLWFEFAGGTWLVVYPTPNAGTARNTQAHLEVRNIDTLVSEMKARGVVFEDLDFGEFGKTEDGIMTAMGWKIAWFKDSEGNTIEITAQVES